MNADWKSGAGRQLQAANQQITLFQGMIAFAAAEDSASQNAIIRKASGFGVSDFTQ